MNNNIHLCFKLFDDDHGLFFESKSPVFEDQGDFCFQFFFLHFNVEFELNIEIKVEVDNLGLVFDLEVKFEFIKFDDP